MNETLITFSTLGGCGLWAGCWLARQPAARQRRVLLGALGLALLPVAALLLAGGIGNDALGKAAGLALVIGLGAAMPVGAGAALGWLCTRLLRRTAATNK